MVRVFTLLAAAALSSPLVGAAVCNDQTAVGVLLNDCRPRELVLGEGVEPVELEVRNFTYVLFFFCGFCFAFQIQPWCVAWAAYGFLSITTDEERAQ
jgi:hypothetical protein